MADRIGKRTGQDAARRGSRRLDDQPHGRRRRPGLRRLTQQENRPPPLSRPTVQPPRGGEIKLMRIAVDLQKNGAKLCERSGLLGDPQGIGEFRRLGDQQLTRCKTKKRRQSGRIRGAGLRKGLADADPQNGKPTHSRARFRNERGKRKRKSRGRASAMHHAAMNFGERRPRQAVAQCTIE